MSSSSLPRQPGCYIPHGGGPCFFMDWSPPDLWRQMEQFLRGFAATLPARPRAILVVSAHWQTEQFSVTAGAQPALLYDYYGFPPHTYELRYPAAGEPALAAQVAARLEAAGFPCHLDGARGFDHGMFIPLMLMFPAADIPVVQLALRADLDPAAHLAAGAALAGLRDEGVLIVGSGMSFHNMRAAGDPRYTAPSEAFDHWLDAALDGSAAQRQVALSQWSQAPHAFDCHPPQQEEHLLPLMVVAGAAGDGVVSKPYSEVLATTRVSAWRFD